MANHGKLSRESYEQQSGMQTNTKDQRLRTPPSLLLLSLTIVPAGLEERLKNTKLAKMGFPLASRLTSDAASKVLHSGDFQQQQQQQAHQ